MTVRHKFSRALYEAYDSQAKDALVSYLEKKDHVVVNSEENYSVDIVSQKHGYTYLNVNKGYLINTKVKMVCLTFMSLEKT